MAEGIYVENLPNGWSYLKLGECCNKISENYEPQKNGKKAYLGLEHLNSGFPNLIGKGFETDVKSSKNTFQKNDLLVGKLRPYLRKAVLANFDGICSTDIFVLRATEKILPSYLIYLIHSDQFIGHAVATTSGVQHPRTSWRALEKFIMPIPPPSEQQKIAHILSTVQRAIEQQERLIQVTTELKKALMHKLFTEGTRGEPQKETEIGLVPESWKVVKLETLGDVSYGIQAAVANNLKPIGPVILTNKNITIDGEIDLEKVNYFKLKTQRDYNSIVQKGDLLFNWRSGSKEHVGKTAYFDLDEEFTHSSFILRIKVNEKNNNRFLFYYLNYLRKIRYYIKVQTYSINAKFNKSAINSMRIAVPSKEEQEEIVSILKPIDIKLKILADKKKKHQELFRTLLHQLMTAQLRVHEIEFEGVEE